MFLRSYLVAVEEVEAGSPSLLVVNHANVAHIANLIMRIGCTSQLSVTFHGELLIGAGYMINDMKRVGVGAMSYQGAC